jgi:hypothetical protein
MVLKSGPWLPFPTVAVYRLQCIAQRMRIQTDAKSVYVIIILILISVVNVNVEL